MTLSPWPARTIQSRVNAAKQRPTVMFTGIKLGSCYWNIINLDIKIQKSQLLRMTIWILGNNGARIKKNMYTKEDLLLVQIFNSTLHQMIGRRISLEISNSMFTLFEQNVVSPVFNLDSCTVEISMSKFYTNKAIKGNFSALQVNQPGMSIFRVDGKKSVPVSGVFFHITDSRILITESIFENIKVNLEAELVVLRTDFSHVEIR